MRRLFRGLLSVHSRYGLHTRAATEFCGPLSEGFSHFVTSIAAPVASGWSISPGGIRTHWKAPPLHGAHPQETSVISVALWLVSELSSRAEQELTENFSAIAADGGLVSVDLQCNGNQSFNMYRVHVRRYSHLPGIDAFLNMGNIAFGNINSPRALCDAGAARFV